MAETLRSEPIDAPDFTASILSRVDAQRAFLAPSVRRKIPWVRLGVLGCVSLVALSGALVLRYAPGSADLVERPAPLTAVVRSVGQQAGGPLENLRQTVRQTVEETVQSVSLAEPTQVLTAVAAAARLPEPALPVVVEPAVEPVTAMALAGGAGEPAFIGPAYGSVSAAPPKSVPLPSRPLASAPVVASARALLTADALLRPRLESSLVPLPQAGPPPGLMDAGLDDLPIVK